MKNLFAILLVITLFCSPVLSQEPIKREAKKQFIYVLKLIPRLLDEKNWTQQDGEIVGRHFRRLQKLHKEGKVILAGRTLNESEPSQFGVVILEVDNEQEARKIMEEDDAVKEKIMTAQLFPFSVALIK
ncbi:MAG TPA: YciI family protein [Blastocatellia bacterium]|nr:YciI family protein [Blastocatellia bacterium]